MNDPYYGNSDKFFNVRGACNLASQHFEVPPKVEGIWQIHFFTADDEISDLFLGRIVIINDGGSAVHAIASPVSRLHNEGRIVRKFSQTKVNLFFLDSEYIDQSNFHLELFGNNQIIVTYKSRFGNSDEPTDLANCNFRFLDKNGREDLENWLKIIQDTPPILYNKF